MINWSAPADGEPINQHGRYRPVRRVHQIGTSAFALVQGPTIGCDVAPSFDKNRILPIEGGSEGAQRDLDTGGV